MSTTFLRGQQLGRADMNIYLDNNSGHPVNAAEISYAIYDFTTGLEVLVGPPKRTPVNPAVGEYYASVIIPLDAQLGSYRVRWAFRETSGGPIQSVVQEFDVIDRNTSNVCLDDFSPIVTKLIGRLRKLLRDNCVAGEELVEVDVEGERFTLTMEELWGIINNSSSQKLKVAFQKGYLKVASVSPDGQVEWKRVLGANRAEIPQESIYEVTTEIGKSVLTGGHRIFVSPVDKMDTDTIQPGQPVLSIREGRSDYLSVRSLNRLESRQYMYDLTVADWHNFLLVRSGMIVSNSPDRNYHFRPPTHEETIRQYNKVFGYIWEDDELLEYLETSMGRVIAAPPRTPFSSLDSMIQYRPEWATVLLTGAMIYALQAMQINWTVEEFSVVGETKIRVILPDGVEEDISIQELYEICYG